MKMSVSVCFFTASVLASSNITIAAKKCEKGKVFYVAVGALN